MSTESPPNSKTDAQFPNDTPDKLHTLTEATYDTYTLQRIHRTVSGDPIGGAIWLADTEAVRVMKYTDHWAVEAPPLEWKVPDYANDGADECLHFIEYEMNAESNLSKQEAYKLADSYMRGEAELADDAWRIGEHDGQQTGQQTLDEATTN